jgi:TPR repeat protein
MLGVIFEKGRLFTLSPDKQKAMEYFSKAASKGDTVALKNLQCK